MWEVDGNTPHRNKKDKWVWKDQQTRLENGSQGQPGWIYTLFLKTKSLSTIQHFTWQVLINKVTTWDKLISRSVEVRSKTCLLCELNDEFVNYLFFQLCSKFSVKNVWLLGWGCIGISQHYKVTFMLVWMFRFE